MSKLQQIVLSAFLHGGTITGEPGQIVDVTDDNRDAAEQLIKDRGARSVPMVALVAAAAAVEALSAVDENDDGLADGFDATDSVDVLLAHKIGARYVQALKDAGLNTIGDVIAKGDALATTAGLTAKAAAAIAELVN